MSHLSQIKTSIYNLNILKATLNNLGFKYKSQFNDIREYSTYKNVDLLVFNSHQVNHPIFGFMHDGQEYILVTDIYFWQLDMSIDSFVDKLTQAYAFNVILDEAENDGFEMISQAHQSDGSIELVVQKWNS